MKRIFCALAALFVVLAVVQSAAASAWTTTYHYGLSASPTSPLGYGITAIKRELYYQGFGKNLVLDTPVFGDAARNRTAEFQKAHGLLPDGVVGPATARVLFRKRALANETTDAIPDHLLALVKTLESANDPAAVGYSDPNDFGLMQIHMPFHPEVTAAQAFDPAFSIPWGAKYLAAAYAQLGDWDAAVASYNVGMFYAKQWLAAGKPASGLLLSDGKTDIYAVVYRYVRLVRSQQW